MQSKNCGRKFRFINTLLCRNVMVCELVTWLPMKSFKGGGGDIAWGNCIKTVYCLRHLWFMFNVRFTQSGGFNTPLIKVHLKSKLCQIWLKISTEKQRMNDE